MKRGLLVGTVGWLVATAVARLWSDALMPQGTEDFVRTFLLCGPVAAAIGILLRLFVCPSGKAAGFGLGLAIPGMILGAATMLAFGDLFPDQTPFARGHYATLILWTNGIILSVIALSIPKPPRPED